MPPARFLALPELSTVRRLDTSGLREVVWTAVLARSLDGTTRTKVVSLPGWWVAGQMDGWMDGWMDGLAVEPDRPLLLSLNQFNVLCGT